MDFEETERQQQAQIGRELNDQVAISKNIKRLAVESEEVATNTMVNLANQRDKLNHVEIGMERIDLKLDEAEEGLDELDKCCGLCVLPWKRWTRAKRTKKFGELDKKARENAAAQNQGNQNDGYTPSGNHNNMKIQQHDINLERIVENDEREDEIHENMKYASQAVGNLHAMALDMGMELDSQNKQLDRIDRNTRSQGDRLADINAQANRRLK